MEQRFGYDFSRVRVHSGPAAEQSAQDVNAHAYTVGHNLVFGAGQYAPDTARWRQVLAHELTHVVQQGGGLAAGSGAARLQRLSFSDVLEEGASAYFGPAGGAVVRLYNLYKQPIDDIIASIKESPQHVWEFLKDEVWESIKNHWVRIMAVTVGLIAAEMVVAALTAAPEPTLLTKVIAVILQIAIIAILGYFAAVEVKGAYEEGRKWLSTAKRAHGDPTVITEASRAFVRMVWHIIMAILTVAGVRARIRGATVPRAGATTGSETSGGAAAAGEGEVIPLSSHPRYQPQFQPRPPSPASGQPAASAFGPGSTARQLAPAEQPLTEPVTVPRAPTPAPAEAMAPSATPSAGSPGVQPVPAVAAGVSAATSTKKKPRFVLRLPQQKAPHLGTYRKWLGYLQSDPNYARGNPGQLDKWHQALRLGGSHAIPASVYERGHTLGFTGASGERRIRVPDWSRTQSIPMEVDHIVELQVTPDFMRDYFNSMDNYELLDRTSNGTSGSLLGGNIAAERAKQVAFDPSAKDRVLLFDEVQLDGGTAGERWSVEAIRAGEQLDAFEKHIK
jgi:Domain of unknown function (DUF4157)